MEDENKLNILERSLMEAVIENSGIEDLESDAFSEEFFKLFGRIREECEASSLKAYKNRAPELLAEIREMEKEFESRSSQRWKPSFDHLEMMWAIAQELGEMHGKAIQAENGKDNDAVMAALVHIFPRSLLVSQEIICLLKGGFPDGALARWRSLHELAVTAMYIAKHGVAAAVPYLLSFHFAARRAAHQMNKYSEQAKIGSFSNEELKEFDARCSGAEEILGRKIEKDKYGEWPAVMQTHTNFAAIEEDVSMDHWRPRYRWASTHTHAHHRPLDKLLGMAEGSSGVHLVGASNSGFVDPFQMTAITLAQITVTYLSHGVNVDRIVHSNVMLSLADEMATISIENERVTYEAFANRYSQNSAS